MPFHLVAHPLVRHKIGLLRKNDIDIPTFRELTTEISAMLMYEAVREMSTQTRDVDGWASKVTVQHIHNKNVTVVPILRAGLGMMNGALYLMPWAKISVMGIYRDEKTLKPVPYFEKSVPNISEYTAIVLDPMLATGGTLVYAVDLLKQKGCRKIKGIFLVASPEGVERMNQAHPEFDIYAAALDERLNSNGYILPGLGDAGDKLFGTL